MLNIKNNTDHFVTGNIKTTKDYSLFKKLLGNRVIKKSHVQKLKKSISEKYIPTCIIVNEKYEIIDGQNRFEALKQLQLPVEYRIVNNLTLKDAIRLNISNSNWKFEDYVNSFAEEGNPYYNILVKASNEYNLAMTLISKCMMKSNKVTHFVKEGEFIINRHNWREIVELFIEYRTKCQIYTHVFTSVILKSKNPKKVLQQLIHKHSKNIIVRFYETDNEMKAEIQRVFNYNNKKNFTLLF